MSLFPTVIGACARVGYIVKRQEENGRVNPRKYIGTVNSQAAWQAPLVVVTGLSLAASYRPIVYTRGKHALNLVRDIIPNLEQGGRVQWRI